MAYAQINYGQKLGNGVYSIAEAGCFLTSFCNLLARFGEPIDPPTLNQDFLAKGVYLADPAEGSGIKDELAWGSVSAFDGRVAMVGMGGAGWPDSNDAIVKFVYRSVRTGQEMTHFCLVQDAGAQLILDSWDGVVKHSPYGQPVAWAKYEHHIPQVVTIPAPSPAPTFTIEDIPTKTEELKVDTHLWDLNRRSWPDMVNNPVGSAGAGTTFTTSQIAHHILGGSYYLPEGSTTQGYNMVDCEVPAPTPVAPPAPVNVYTTNTVNGVTFDALDNAPRRMWVSKQGGAEKWSFSNVTTWRDFKSVAHVDYGTEVWIAGIAHHPIPPVGADYDMTSDDFGDFKRTGQVANWYGFNHADLSDTRPAPIAAVQVTPPDPTPAPAVEPTSAPAPELPAGNWQATYVPFPKAVDYITTKNMVIKDLSGQQPDAPMPQGTKVKSYGTVLKDGVRYYRIRTKNDPIVDLGNPNFTYWYAVPSFDPTTHMPNLLAQPKLPVQPVSTPTIARDTLELVKTRFETEAGQLLDDLVPRFLRRK